MTECCSNAGLKPMQACPQCQTICQSVTLLTLYHQVSFPDNQALAPGEYYFCASKGCSVGYFSNQGVIIPKARLRACQAIEKDTLCYCFDIGREVYLSELRANQAEPIKNYVIQRTKLGECAYEFRNPSGRCCLVKFKHLDTELSRKD